MDVTLPWQLDYRVDAIVPVEGDVDCWMVALVDDHRRETVDRIGIPLLADRIEVRVTTLAHDRLGILVNDDDFREPGRLDPPFLRVGDRVSVRHEITVLPNSKH